MLCGISSANNLAAHSFEPCLHFWVGHFASSFNDVSNKLCYGSANILKPGEERQDRRFSSSTRRTIRSFFSTHLHSFTLAHLTLSLPLLIALSVTHSLAPELALSMYRFQQEELTRGDAALSSWYIRAVADLPSLAHIVKFTDATGLCTRIIRNKGRCFLLISDQQIHPLFTIAIRTAVPAGFLAKRTLLRTTSSLCVFPTYMYPHLDKSAIHYVYLYIPSHIIGSLCIMSFAPHSLVALLFINSCGKTRY